MSKIQQIIREAIGEDKPTGFIGENSHLDTTFFKQEIGYQQALADLRNKIPEIEKKIIEEIEKFVLGYYKNVMALSNGKLPFVVWEGKAGEAEKVAIYEQGVKDTLKIIRNLTS
jgi:hypothetical protein